jgi:acyl-CoA thioesterase FadM
MHMNNASYLRCAEYSRWRFFFGRRSSDAAMFIVSENRAQYFKPIMPFQIYDIVTTISASENKWLHYKHTFKHPSKDDVIYAVVETKAVLKEKNGKTIPLDVAAKQEDWLRVALKRDLNNDSD